MIESPLKRLHVDAREFKRIKGMVPPNVGLWINAKEDEVLYGRGAGHLASCRSMSLSVSSELVALDERSGMSVGADSEETKGPLRRTAQFDESDEKRAWTWLLYTVSYTEASRADARHLHRLKEFRGRPIFSIEWCSSYPLSHNL